MKIARAKWPSSASSDLSRVRVFIHLRDPESELKASDKDIAAIFGLSSAEANVCWRLAAGQSPQEIAKVRGASLATVRNQIKSAQFKIGVSRQAELVSVVLRALYI